MSSTVTTDIGRVRDPLERFFAYAREREAIRVRREHHHLKEPPFTRDRILQKYRFCNVFREDDRTTRWYARHVREAYRDTDLILLATVVFRWFNRIETGQALFCQTGIEGTPFEVFARTGSREIITRAVRALLPRGPWVTGSYMVPSPNGVGLDKLHGIAECCARFWATPRCGHAEGLGDIDWREMTEILRTNSHWHDLTLEWVWGWVREHDFQGDFNAYEVVTDLRHSILSDAPDTMTWANPGPGARRGLNRIHKRGVNARLSREQCIEEMRQLLEVANNGAWPDKIEGVAVPRWEMRDVEHTLCEHDKYERTRLGQGRTRGVFA